MFAANHLGQTFESFDLVRLLFLIVLEILLSADNAIVIGLLIRRLREVDRKKALLIGSLSAIVLRALGILGVSFLFTQIWIQIAGALYLIYLAVRHFVRQNKQVTSPITARGFWNTIFLIECFDIAFAIDSIIAGLAFINEIPSVTTAKGAVINPKLWIVYIGALVGLLAIRSAAHYFSKLIDRFPRLERAAYMMVGWIGLKLGFSALGLLPKVFLEAPFWIVLILLFLFGLVRKSRSHG